MHNSLKDTCTSRDGHGLRHCFPDFKNLARCHAADLDRDQELFQRVDFVEGNQSGGNCSGDDCRDTDKAAVDVQQQAYDTGYQEGVTVGRRAAEARLQPLAESLQKALQDVNRIAKQVYSTAEIQSVELALAVARKIIGREVAVDRSVVAHTLRRAIKGLARGSHVTVVLNPEDIAFLRKISSKDLLGPDQEMIEIDFEADPAVAPGGCLLKTAAGDRDATIEGQMDRVTAAFQEALVQAHHEKTVAEKTGGD